MVIICMTYDSVIISTTCIKNYLCFFNDYFYPIYTVFLNIWNYISIQLLLPTEPIIAVINNHYDIILS